MIQRCGAFANCCVCCWQGEQFWAQYSSEVLWSKFTNKTQRAYFALDDDGGFRQLGVYWHWSDAVLNGFHLVKVEHCVFKIGTRRRVGSLGRGVYVVRSEQGTMVCRYTVIVE